MSAWMSEKNEFQLLLLIPNTCVPKTRTPAQNRETLGFCSTPFSRTPFSRRCVSWYYAGSKRTHRKILLSLMLFLTVLPYSTAFSHPTCISLDHSRLRRASTQLSLLPLASLSEELPRYKLRDNIGLYVPEQDDLPEISTFIVKAFGADAINLSQDFNAVEQFLLQPVAGFLNGYSGMAAYTEVLAGLNQRLRSRIEHPSVHPPALQGLSSPEEQARAASRASLLFVLAKCNSNISDQDKANSNNNANDDEKDHEVVASVELRLEWTDGKIPFSLPWLDQAERTLARMVGWSPATTNNLVELQPYLSSLCVGEEYRKCGLGRTLVHCCEDVARICWGCDRLYLHVDPDNTAAVNLYISEGYREVKGIRWNPFWAGQASSIGYYVKELS